MHPAFVLLSWTSADLIQHLWQSSVIALALLVLMGLCARFSARTRLALVWMALAKFALPFGILAALVTLIGGNPQNWLVSRVLPTPFMLETPALAAHGADPRTPGTDTTTPSGTTATATATVLFDGANVGDQGSNWSWTHVLLGVWLAGFTTLFSWWLLGGYCLRRRLLADAQAISLEMYARLESAAARVGLRELPRCVTVGPGHSPGLLGVFFPILTLPAELEKNLTAAELESVLLHELIHVRRRDPFWLAVHVTGVCALWFNPVAWLLGRWIRLETEKSCDERVLELTGRPDTYAHGLLKVVHLALGLPAPSLVGAITPPVVSRVQNILRHGQRTDRRSLRLTALAVGVFLLALGGNTGTRASTTEVQADSAESEAASTTISSFHYLPPVPAAMPATVISRMAAAVAPSFAPPETLRVIRQEIVLAPIADPAPEATPDETLALDATAQEAVTAPEAVKSDPLPSTESTVEPPVALADAASGGEGATESAGAPAFDLGVESLPLDPFPVFFASLASPVPEAQTQGSATFGPTGPIIAAEAELAGPLEPAKIYAHQDVDSEPIALLQVKPEYPGSLKRAGIEGSATIAFTVDLNGTPQNVRSVKPTDRLFAEAAVAAVRQLRYLPGLKNGLPVATAMELPFSFHIRANPEPTPALAVTPAASAAQPAVAPPSAAKPVHAVLANAYHPQDLDVIPVAMFQPQPVYPADLKRAGIAGKTTVSFVVDAKGNVKNVRPVDSTDRRFEAAAIAAVSKWKFQPGRRDGESVPALVVIPFYFNLSNRF
jgi:TonB family protein